VNTSNMLSSESYISLDQVDLEVVLLNLVNNAKDAIGSAQGMITVSSYLCEPDAERVKTPGLEEQPWLCLCVKDNGMGMSVDQLSRVLDPFFTTKSPGDGVGLGLAISFNIVKDFGGSMRASSEPEGLTTFRVTLNKADRYDG